ncbi:AAA family ATPase [Hymenobacter rubidus]|uniref:AAA family ATPase n=1 Tax=Hymenobacter rubidus TaxID=1441626 RepID=UPI00191FCF7E|nr:AAA family ATPase [Hymenobacter rubidus]
MPTRAQAPAVPRLTYLRIKNYRALRDVEFRDLTPLTVLIGPNGSGKSTVLDALDFLAEAVRGNLIGAWEKRNRFAGMRTRGSEGDIEFEVDLWFQNQILKYRLQIGEFNSEPHVLDERLTMLNSKKQAIRSMGISLREENGRLNIVSIGSRHQEEIGREPFLNVLPSRQFPSLIYYVNIKRSAFPGTSQLIDALTSYHYVHLTDDHLKGYSDAGPREKLSPNGDNLPNVLYYLHTRHPETLAKITAQLRKWVPGLADVVPEITSDERILLRFKDAQFEKPLPAQYMSGGTMRLAALLTLLHETNATGLLGIEEPENELHPQLLYHLTEEFEKAAEKRQLFVTTHSPLILDALSPEQVWVMYRGADGYAHATRTADMPNVPELAEDGSMLGYLWTSNTFTVGDPQAPFKANPDAR